MVEIRGLRAAIEDKPILQGIDLTVPQGEVRAIMGPNGSGKSTLAYVLSGREDYAVTAGRRQCQLHAHGAERVAPLARRSRAGCGAVSPAGAGRDEAACNARGHAA